jgi:hypothetical protein
MLVVLDYQQSSSKNYTLEELIFQTFINSCNRYFSTFLVIEG